MRDVRSWPEAYGFNIAGQGPTYVTKIQDGGVAYRAGLKTGDMLLEVSVPSDVSCLGLNNGETRKKICNNVFMT